MLRIGVNILDANWGIRGGWSVTIVRFCNYRSPPNSGLYVLVWIESTKVSTREKERER